jgi:hypothetical protein
MPSFIYDGIRWIWMTDEFLLSFKLHHHDRFTESSKAKMVSIIDGWNFNSSLDLVWKKEEDVMTVELVNILYINRIKASKGIKSARMKMIECRALFWESCSFAAFRWKRRVACVVFIRRNKLLLYFISAKSEIFTHQLHTQLSFVQRASLCRIYWRGEEC